jgi:hypothetical protein
MTLQEEPKHSSPLAAVVKKISKLVNSLGRKNEGSN